MKLLIPIMAACALLISCSSGRKPISDRLDYAKINAEARSRYLDPIRPGYEGRNPFWNGFSKKFIYAPAFDFDGAENAAAYRFTISTADGKGSWSFTADTPTAALSPVWDDVAVGDVHLAVEALDAAGQPIATVGERDFWRDYPFCGPYNPPLRDYRSAACMALVYIHFMPEIQHWRNHTEPDMNYGHNTYVCKIVGATVRSEVLLAKLMPEHAAQATAIACNAARFLIDRSQPEGHPLAFFPPTYYKDLIASQLAENQNKTMMMEATAAGQAFLDLYDLTGDTCYYNHAIGIADTYRRLQREDGSFPIKVDFSTGESVNDACAMLDPLLSYLQRLKTDYGVEDYADMQAKGERWMRDMALGSFDMTGQFEDVSVLGLKPYENLTNCTAAPYATYLLSRGEPTDEEMEYAVDLTRLSEDQFTFWDTPVAAGGFKNKATPCVYEQYKYQTPVDNSACNVANAMLSLYEATGDMLCFAKGKALIDNITVVQNPLNGQIPTTWDFRTGNGDRYRTYWINCTYSSVTTLLRMADLVENAR